MGKSVLLAGIDAPDPVYFCSAEPPSAGAFHSFEKVSILLFMPPSLNTFPSEGNIVHFFNKGFSFKRVQ